MRGSVLRGILCSGAAVALLVCAGCARSAPAARGNTAAGGTPVYDAWTTPPEPGSTYVAQPANAAALQPAPQAVSPTPGQVNYPSPRYVPPSSAGVASYPGGTLPPPPPPPDSSLPVVGAPVAQAPAPAFPAPSATNAIPPTDPRVPAGARGIWVVPERTYTCGLPCADGISQWHIRGVLGLATFHGTDAAENCTYYGVDIGRTFCGCWGLDLYYRYNSGRFTREPTAGSTFEDGGWWHHFGAKVTMERAIAGSKFYWWAGVGGGWFTTQNYVSNDSGPEVFGEAGVGYALNRNWRLRAGVNVHGMDTDVTRRLPANDGQSRWLWLIAPVVEAEFSF